MLTKTEVFNIIQDMLVNRDIDGELAEEVADSLVEVLDENGLFEEASSESTYD
jgi:hypothetical protein